MDGLEVVLVYEKDEVSSVTRPVKELKAYQKISINKGELKLLNWN
jgi:beta-glucosidase